MKWNEIHIPNTERMSISTEQAYNRGTHISDLILSSFTLNIITSTLLVPLIIQKIEPFFYLYFKLPNKCHLPDGCNRYYNVSSTLSAI